jgi:hypothetical protein
MTTGSDNFLIKIIDNPKTKYRAADRLINSAVCCSENKKKKIKYPLLYFVL